MSRESFAKIAEQMRDLGVTAIDVTIATGKTAKIVGQSLTGRHPFIGNDLIPKPIADYLTARGVEVPAEIIAVEDGCEWNPSANTPAHTGEHHTRTVQAQVIVGADGQWRLCEPCATLPAFRRYKKRTAIKR